ncbi:glycosyl transferase family 1, partial [Priestia megaterium]
MKKRILILNGQYLPGFKGGGPIQSCVNMVENLSDEFEFYVLTADRDFKSTQQYKDILVNSWNQVGSAKVFYMSPDMQTLKGFKKTLNEIDYDLLYLNGFFSPIFTIKPLVLRKLGLLKQNKIILTPRGDFTGGTEKK